MTVSYASFVGFEVGGEHGLTGARGELVLTLVRADEEAMEEVVPAAIARRCAVMADVGTSSGGRLHG